MRNIEMRKWMLVIRIKSGSCCDAAATDTTARLMETVMVM